MIRRFGILLAFTAACLGTIAFAEDQIYLKTKAAPAKGAIVSESSKEVALKGGAKFAAEDVDDILYEWPAAGGFSVEELAYKQAFNSERAWLSTSDPTKKKNDFKNALESYE